MSTIFSSLVFDVKMKSSSTHSTYFVITCDTAKFLPANQPCVMPKKNLFYNSTLWQHAHTHTHRRSCLSKRHDVVLNVRPPDWLRMLIVVGYHYSDSGVELPDAVNQVLQFVVAQEGLGGDGNQSADVVLCRRAKGQRLSAESKCWLLIKSKSFQLPFFFFFFTSSIHWPFWCPEKCSFGTVSCSILMVKNDRWLSVAKQTKLGKRGERFNIVLMLSAHTQSKVMHIRIV